MRKPYYLNVRITYADMLSFQRKYYYYRAEYDFPESNMKYALYDIISRFYAENQDADIIELHVLENYLYKEGEKI